MNFNILLYWVCCCIYIFIGIKMFAKNTRSKLNRIFLALCLSLALWAFLYVLIISASDTVNTTYFRRYANVTWSFFYCTFLYFFIYLTKNDNKLKRWWHHVAIFIPAIFTIILYSVHPMSTADSMSITNGWGSLTPRNKGLLWHYYFSIYYLSYTIMGIILLLRWRKTTKSIREKKVANIIALSIVLTLLMGIITDIILPLLKITQIPPLSIVFIIISIIATWYAISQFRLITISPETVVHDIFKIMNEGLILVNRDGMILEANKVALQLLAYSEKELYGEDITKIFPESIDLSVLEMCKSRENEIKSKNNQKIPVLTSTSVLKDEWGDKLGTILIFQDISEMKNIQKELKNSYDHLELRVEDRTQKLLKLNVELETEIKARISMEEKIRELALYDHLTRLPNRRLFHGRLQQAILEAQRSKKQVAVLFLDLDLFKLVNDTMGHAQGDELLKEVSHRLRHAIRKSGTIARVGGDEFLILIPNIVNEYTIKKTSESIISIFKEPFELNNYKIYMTTSMGVAVYPDDGEDVDTLIKNADVAMYNAKEGGKNKFKICSPSIKKKINEEMKMTNDLYKAIEKGELELYYQPQVNSTTGEIVCFEALIRWNHPELGLVSPSNFIPIAEKTGLIMQIGEWVLRTACKQNKAWQEARLINVPIAVNLSVNQFKVENFAETIRDILNETGLNPCDLELEITENIIMKDIEDIIKTLEQLKLLGIEIALDDFGKEYSSLNYFKQLPVDKIKIAMEFMGGIYTSTKDEAIITTIISLGRSLGLKVVAEGIEEERQMFFLKERGCELIQGFYYYKPMKSKDVELLIKSKSKNSWVYPFEENTATL